MELSAFLQWWEDKNWSSGGNGTWEIKWARCNESLTKTMSSFKLTYSFIRLGWFVLFLSYCFPDDRVHFIQRKLWPFEAFKIFTHNIWHPFYTFQEYQETGPKGEKKVYSRNRHRVNQILEVSEITPKLQTDNILKNKKLQLTQKIKWIF